MKKSKIALVSLLSLLMLAGCRAKTSTSSTSETPISQISSVAPESSSAPASSSTPVSSTPVSSKPEESSTPVSSTSSIYDTDWDRDLVDEMVQDLNYVLPYVNMGKNIDYEYTASSYYSSTLPYLEISGDYTYEEIKDAAKKAFEDDGWTVTCDDYSFYATKDELHLAVTIVDDDEMEVAVLTCTYDEPFDSTTCSAWTEDGLDTMDTYLDGHTLPYFYLGTSNPTFYWSTYSSYLSIYGNKWDDSVLTLAQAALEADGWTCTTEKVSAGNYDFKSGTEYLVCTKTFDDGCTITLYVGKSYYGKAYAEAYLTEEYNPEGYTWNEEIQGVIDEYFDGHQEDIPAIYLGTKNPYNYYSSYSGSYTISGNWNDAMWEDVKATLEDAGYTVTEEESDYYGKEYIATKVCEDGCTIEITFYEYSYSEKAYLYIALKKAWDPTSLTAWTEDILTDFEDYFPDYDVPFLYLGTDTPSGSYYSYYGYYEIDGGEWNDEVLTLAESTLTEADGWTLTHGTSYYLSSTDIFQKDLGDGYVMQITIDKDYNDKINMEVSLIEKFDPTSCTDWSDDGKDTFEDYFDNHIPPFVYMGMREPDFYYSTYYGYLTITGGNWDDQEYALFEAAYNEESGWTVTSETAGSSQYTYETGSTIYTATKDFGDGYVMEITFGEYGYSDKSYMVVKMHEKYDPTTFTGWSTDVKDDFDEYFDGHVLPAAYIGARNPTGEYSDYYYEYEITGGQWCDDIATNLKTAYEADGWTCEEYEDNGWDFDSDETAYKFTKAYDDGCTITVLAGADYYLGNALLIVTMEQVMVVDESITAWPTTFNSTFNSSLGGHTIPYFWTNTATPTMYDSYSTYIEGGKWNDGIIDLAKAAFEADGWTVIVTAKADTYYQYGDVLTATKDFDDGKTITVTVQSSYSKTCYVYLEYKDTFTVNPDVTSWGEDYETYVDTYMNGYGIPYMYIGDEPYAAYSTYGKYIEVTGDLFDQKIYTLADATYTTEDGWVKTTSASYYGTVYTYTKVLESGDTVIVQVYEDWDDQICVDYYYKKKYVVDTTITDWSADVKEDIEACCNNEDLPYFYMGSNPESSDPYTSSYYGYTYMSIRGDFWDDAAVTEFKNAYSEDDGWTITEEDGYYGTQYTATKENEDGSTIEVEFYNNGYGIMQLYIYYYEATSTVNP